MRDSEENDGYYKVGYKNPPLETRFKKGHAGRPRGKAARKGKEAPGRDFFELVLSELEEPVSVIENGKQRKMRGTKVGAKNMAKDIIRGDPKARAQLLQAIKLAKTPSPSTALLTAPEPVRRPLEEIMFDFVADMREETYQMLCATSRTVSPDEVDDEVKRAIKEKYYDNFGKNDVSEKMVVIMLMSLQHYINTFSNRRLK